MADRDQQPQQREMVYCHQCENEWYRDEHGIICPDCQSDFTEIIEDNNDPRADDEPDVPPLGGFYAPDPDEDDIDNLHWQQNGPGETPGGRLRYTQNIRLGPGGQQEGGAGGLAGGLLGLIGGIIGGQQQQQRPDQEGQAGQPGQPGQSNAPGSPRGQQQQAGDGRSFVRHGSGPGYSFTITTSSNTQLFPRNANQPQPFQDQPDQIERMMAQMFMNIGAMPGQGGGPFIIRGGMPGGGMPGGGMGGAGGGGGLGGPIGLGALLQMLGHPPGGVHGDAVYSQEALDRIITQLMEQHQTGNAPGPATEEAIESLPKRQVTEKDQDEAGKANCVICMDECELGATVTELPCHHWFHHDCIKHWLKEHDTCPQCRQGIMPKEGNDTSRPRQPNQAPLNDMHSPEYRRPSVQGGYPFPRQDSSGAGGSGTGSRSNPFTVPESPDSRRSASPRAERSGGMFSRMRDVFSPRDSNPRGGDGGSGNSYQNPPPS